MSDLRPEHGMLGNPRAVIEAGNGDPDAKGYTTTSYQDGSPSEGFVYFTDDEKRLRKINWEKQENERRKKEETTQATKDRKAWLKANPPEAILSRSAETKTTLETEINSQTTLINKLKESIQAATETLKTLEDYKKTLSKRPEEYSLFAKIIGTQIRDIEKIRQTTKRIEALESKQRLDSIDLEHEENYLAELQEKLAENAEEAQDAIQRMPRE